VVITPLRIEVVAEVQRSSERLAQPRVAVTDSG
jgi:hypothetical protein